MFLNLEKVYGFWNVYEIEKKCFSIGKLFAIFQKNHEFGNKSS